MNWRFTRPGTVRFNKGEPFCFFTPVPHAILDQITPVIRPLADNPELKREHEAWSEDRRQFNKRLAERDPATVEVGWQKNYVRGEGPEGVTTKPAFHLSKRKLPAPKKA